MISKFYKHYFVFLLAILGSCTTNFGMQFLAGYVPRAGATPASMHRMPAQRQLQPQMPNLPQRNSIAPLLATQHRMGRTTPGAAAFSTDQNNGNHEYAHSTHQQNSNARFSSSGGRNSSFLMCLLGFFVGTSYTVSTCSDGQNNFDWNGRRINWYTAGGFQESNETRSLSDCKGPFDVKGAIGSIEVREGTPPRLEIQKLLASESMDDIDTKIQQGYNGTAISTDIKNDTIKGKGVNYTLYLPQTEKISTLSLVCGSILARFRGYLGTATTSNGSINANGVTPYGSQVNLKNSNGSISAQNINGTVDARTSNGKVVMSNIHGNAYAHTSNGKIEGQNIDGSATANTSNGRIGLDNVDGSVQAKSSNSRIELYKIAGSVQAKTSNGNVYRDGKKI